MKIRSEKEEIDFSVVDYQFPEAEKSKPNDFDYDANWLKIRVTHTKDGKTEPFEDSCVLTYELEELADAVADLLSGKKNSYISEFMEPYLRFAIAEAEGRYMVQIQFVSYADKDRWDTVGAAQLFSAEMLADAERELRGYLRAYPKR